MFDIVKFVHRQGLENQFTILDVFHSTKFGLSLKVYFIFFHDHRFQSIKPSEYMQNPPHFTPSIELLSATLQLQEIELCAKLSVSTSVKAVFK